MNELERAGTLGEERAVVIGNTAYVWRERVDRTSIGLRHVRDRASAAVNVAILVAGVVGVLWFVVQVVILGRVERLIDPAFWVTPNLGLFGIFFALLCALFVGYRLTEATREKVIIPKRPYDAPLPTVDALPTRKHELNIARVFESTAMKTVEDAFELAQKFGHAEVAPLHLFIASLSSEKCAVVFGRLGVRFDSLQPSFARKLGELPIGPETQLGASAVETLLAAFLNAYTQSRHAVSPLELMQEAYRRDEFVKELLYGKEVTEERFDNVVEWVRINDQLRERYERFRKAALRKPVGAMNRSMTSVATPNLDRVTTDLTADAVYGRLPLLIGRDKEMENMFRVIEGGNQSVVLVGPSGVGKDALLAGVAERMVEENVPRILQDKRLVSLSLPALLSGAGPAEAQERLVTMLNEIARSANIVLAIPNVEQLTGLSSGGEHSMDLTSILVEALNRGFTFVIATTTPDAYVAVVESSVLGRQFQKVTVGEPDVNTAIRILETKAASIENQNGVIFAFEALEACAQLSDRYIHEKYLPEKAIEIAKEVALDTRKNKGVNTLVTKEDVARIVAAKTNIPVTQVGAEEREKLLHLEDQMHGRVIGQEEAVKAVASALRRARAELKSENRPIANFLFLGPTGVGKTELAKTVAESYFGDEKAMQRFDMSEYQDKASVYRLIGSPGSKEGGLLTEAVRQHPFSIVLLDELEKAHPDILNLFLQVMDDGRLTDNGGRTIDFTNTILIATSNAGTQFIQDSVRAGMPVETIKTQLMESELKTVYRPEFLNRFDAVIVFKPLTSDDVLQIAYLMVNKVAERLEAKGIHFRAEDAAVAELAQKGFDPTFGARPLRRVVQEQVDNALATTLLEGKIGRRDTVVLKPGGTIEIEKAPEL